MKQLLQSLSTGETTLIETPRPAPSSRAMMIDSIVSLVSVGTERTLVNFGRASLLQKARQQPDRVRDVIAKARTDGLLTTIDAVRSKLGQPLPLGYSNVGIVADTGAPGSGFRIGDRVVSNGSHAEVVRVPHNLCAKIPKGVDDETAAFTVVASIGLQGVRLAAPMLGERLVVIGVGLIGLLTVQILLANGCRVLAIDYDEDKLALARLWGAQSCNLGAGEDALDAATAFTGGMGADAVLITASTSSSDPVTQAAKMSRKRGRIVLVGVAGLELDRGDFYEKELSFQVSCSYGPGRYDPSYEEGGKDYPPGFVRWTEQRNFTAVLELMAAGKIHVAEMLSLRVPFEDAPTVYRRLSDDKTLLGVLLRYDRPVAERQDRTVIPGGRASRTSAVLNANSVFGVVGAGNYAARVLIPALRASGASLGSIVTSSGLSGSIAAENHPFSESTTDLDAVLNDGSIDALVIATHHDSHAHFAARAIAAGKHVFVEKPLALDRDSLAKLRAAIEASRCRGGAPRLMVGFNRRWAPMVQKMKALLDREVAPKSFLLTVNAGVIPAAHWVQDLTAGGGRIIGETCHFIDLMRFLAGAPITHIYARRMGDNPAESVTEDKAFLTLDFADGSHGVIAYLGNGSSAFPKERIEAFAAGRVLQLNNYRALRGYGWRGFRKMTSMKQDKGQQACIAAFHQALRKGEPSPIDEDELFEVSERTIEAAEQLRAQ